MNIGLRQLSYFVAVAEELHVGRAAEKLRISQPPVTRQIQQLEETLGSPLFIRHAKGVSLTPEGELFLDEARTILLRVDQAAERVKQARNGELGQIDVAMFGSAVFGRIPEIVLAFRHRYPNVKVVLHTMSKARQLDALANRSIDLAFNRIIAPRAGLAVEVLFREPLHVAMPESSPFAARDAVPFSALDGVPMIAFPASPVPGFIQQIRTMCASAGIVANIVQEVGDPVSGLALVAADFGLCIVPESLLAVSLPGIVFRPITGFKGDLSVDLSIAYRKNDRAPVVENFAAVAREICAGYDIAPEAAEG